MNLCLFCLMRTQGSLHLKEPIAVTLTADSMRQPYFVVVVPTCQAHASIPGILDRVMAGPEGTVEETHCYDESVKLFEKKEGSG